MARGARSTLEEEMVEKWTEEELRVRVIAPLLSAFGLSPNQISFERELTVKLGRIERVLGGTSTPRRAGSRKVVSGRYDVLVKNDEGEPLFIVETKSPQEAITKADCEQCVSYARALRPRMAPFAVITNGADTRILDTFTEQDLSGTQVVSELSARWENWKRGGFVSPDDLRLRAEALEYFLGYSAENVLLFCDAQREARLLTLRAEPGTTVKKYIPDVYVPRPQVRESIREFLAGTSTVFALSGGSGVGKTNEMCALAEELGGKGYPTLFFSGTELHSDPVNAIAEELNWNFTDQLTPPQIASRLDKLAERTGRPVLILIDAAEDARVSNMNVTLSNLTDRLHQFGGSIRLIFAIKSNQWPEYASIDGSPSRLAEYCWRPKESAELERRSEGEASSSSASLGPLNRATTRPYSSSIELGCFSLAEKTAAVEHYKSAFAISGEFSQEVMEAVSDPFLLRILSETYGNTGRAVPRNTKEIELLRRYVTRKLDTVDPARRQAVLTEIAAVASSLDKALSASSTLRHDELHGNQLGGRGHPEDGGTRAGFRAGVEAATVPDETVAEFMSSASRVGSEAIALGILFETFDDHGRRHLGFQYDRIRDYVLAYHGLKLDLASQEELLAELEGLLSRPVSREAFRLYLSAITAEQKVALDSFFAKRVEVFAQTYEAIRRAVGPALRRRMPPRTDEPAGVIYARTLEDYWCFGFYERRAASGGELVIKHPSAYELTHALHYNPPRVKPLPIGVWGRSSWNLLCEPEDYAAGFAVEVFRDIAARGGLDESCSKLVTLEKLFDLVNTNRRELGLSETRAADASESSMPTDLLPLELEPLRRWVCGEYGAMEAMFGSYGSSEERLEAARIAREQALDGRRFERQPSWRNNLPTALDGILDALGSNLDVISHYCLPTPDLPKRNGVRVGSMREESFGVRYSDHQFKKFLKSVLHHALREYQKIADENFGPIAGRLGLYRSLPLIAVLHYWPSRERADEGASNSDQVLCYAFAENKGGKKSSAEAYAGEDEDPFPKRDSGEPLFQAETSYGIRPLLSGVASHRYRGLHYTRLESSICRSYDTPPFEVNGVRAHFTPIRKWVYTILIQDLEALSPDQVREALVAARAS